MLYIGGKLCVLSERGWDKQSLGLGWVIGTYKMKLEREARLGKEESLMKVFLIEIIAWSYLNSRNIVEQCREVFKFHVRKR